MPKPHTYDLIAILQAEKDTLLNAVLRLEKENDELRERLKKYELQTETV